jgi:hypothetical protein
MVAVWTEPLALGGDARWEWLPDRSVVVTPKATFAYLGERRSISGEASTTALVSLSQNCADDHALPLLSEGPFNVR